MAPGVLPFRGESSGVIFNAILERAPVSPVRLNPDIPLELENVISKALEKDQRFRYQSAADTRTDLQRLRRETTAGTALRGSSRQVRSPAPSAKSRHWPLSAGIAALVLVVTAAIAYYFFGYKAQALSEKDTVVVA